MSKIVNIYGFSDESGEVIFNFPDCLENISGFSIMELFIRFDQSAANICGKVVCNWLISSDEKEGFKSI